MIYVIEFKEQALKEIKSLKKSEVLAYKKLVKLLEELTEHPTTGTGKPEQLKGDRSGQWSRRITQKHRLIYTIEQERITVIILSLIGHYGNK